MFSPRSSAISRQSRAHSNTSGSSPEVPAQGTGSPTGSVSVPLFILYIWGALKTSVGRQPPLISNKIPFNGTGVGCIENESIINVGKFGPVAEGQLLPQEDVQIHAHKVAIETSAGADKARHYAVGQSPLEEPCLNFVLQGVQSGLGLFQFVSSKAHHDPRNSSTEPISAMLKRLLKSAKDDGAGGLKLDERYKLKAITEIEDVKDATLFSLEIVDSGVKVGESPKNLTIPLMQAGLKFTKKLLRVKEIKRASELMGPCPTPSTLPSTPEKQCDPLILSTAGHGRNAVLMTYREIVRQIDEGIVTDELSLGEALHAVILKGRETRSPHFVHSKLQLEQLYLALKDELLAKAASPVSSNEGAARRRLQDNTKQTSQKVLANQPSFSNVEAELISDHEKIKRFFLPSAKFGARDILEIREQNDNKKLITKHFKRISKNINTVGADQTTWLNSSTHDYLIMLGLRSMSLIGKSIEANALFNVLVNNIGLDDKEARVNLFRAALLEPVLLSATDASYESYFFPCKTLLDSTIKKMGLEKAALFEKQNALYSAHRNASDIDVPLKAFFSKEAKVDSYSKGEHLGKTIHQLNPCTVSSTKELYFASDETPEPSVYEVHVDFANASLGGDWKGDGSFAQEEVAFIENVGLGAVASYAQEKVKWLKGFTNYNLPSSQRHYGENFLTRHSDNTPAPILIEGAERVAQFSSHRRDAASLEKCLPTNWLAIAAPDSRNQIEGKPWKNASGDQLHKVFKDIFSAAHAGFTMAKFTAGEDKTNPPKLSELLITNIASES
ncbi:MAG: hypothetical protein ACI802_000893 [Candidatus Paceibacteria bacterium]|jgi:hypothetical protein